MKSLFATFAFAFASIGAFPLASLAAPPAAPAAPVVKAPTVTTVKDSDLEFCSMEVAACAKAGYYIGGFKTFKGLDANCLYPLANDKKVGNVNVKMNDACKKLKLAAEKDSKKVQMAAPAKK